MYISVNWLKDYIKIPAKLKPKDIADGLTGHTVEVEGLIDHAEQFNNVVVGKVLEVNKHPNADRLRLVVIDIKKEKLNIVCGAPNIAVGQLVPVALIGAKLPNGLEIKESLIRGEKSSGMVCAEDELGLGDSHEGIMVLKDNAKIGEPFAKHLKLDDTILEVDNKSLSNRPDLLNHYGLAREVAAIFNLPLKDYEKFLNKKWKFLSSKENKLEVKVEATELCPRYMALRIDNIEVKDSPTWLKERLIAVNQRPINNIVDLTNYIMLDCGQPMHAFDADQVKKIVVRRAKKDETIETLDEKERVLSVDDLVITDGDQALAIAGVMGGKNSQINPDTKSLLLESANFTAASIRKTSQKLGLRTEASVRYEKSLDPKLTEAALLRFLALLAEICPDMKISSSLVDVYREPAKELVVGFNLAWLTQKIGQEIPREIAANILNKLGFKINRDNEEEWQVTIPSWRATKDVSAKEDLAEEVLRLYGYDNIDARLPMIEMRLPEVNEERLIERKIKTILTQKHSLNEAYNYSFVGEDQLKKLNIDFLNYLKLANPLSDVQTMLRQTLVPGLVGNIKTNQFKLDDFGFFEIGSVFFNAPGDLQKEVNMGETLPYQEKHLGLVLTGNDDLFRRLKGIVDSLFKNLINFDIEAEFLPLEVFPGWADKNSVARIIVLGQEIGLIAMLNDEAGKNVNLKKSVALAEINQRALIGLILGLPSFRSKETPKYPAVSRDLAFVVEEKILYNDLHKEIMNFNPLIRSVELFDVYAGNKLMGGQKSLAFHLSYQSEERTLTAAEIDAIQKELVNKLVEKFEVKLRDF